MSLLEKAKASLPKAKVGTPKKPKVKVSQSGKPKTKTQKKPKVSVDSRIIGFIGKQGTGKTYSAMSFGKFGNVMYLDSESKAQIIKEAHFSEYNIDIRPFRQVDAQYRLNKLATVQYFEKNTPLWIKELKTGAFKVVVIDNCDIFRPYAKYEWLRRNPKRVKPQTYEWGEIEEIVQDFIYPYINLCRSEGLILILCFGIKDLYLNDTVIGTSENAKQWILGELDVEMWLEWDYKRFCLKHPYKPFWEYRDQDEFPADYLLNSDFIDEYVIFKEYQQFKEETLVSEGKKQDIKRSRKSLAIK